MLHGGAVLLTVLCACQRESRALLISALGRPSCDSCLVRDSSLLSSVIFPKRCRQEA